MLLVSCRRITVCLGGKCPLRASWNYLSADATHNAKQQQQQQQPADPDQVEYRNEPPDHPSRDWIGPVDKRSNLRQISFAQPQDETETERGYREIRQEIHKWNHAFWAQHNQNFIQAKELFVKKALAKKGVGLLDEDGAKRVLSAEEMAEFYKEFLQDNRLTLQQYNRDWYRKNTALLWPAMKIAMRRLVRR